VRRSASPTSSSAPTLPTRSRRSWPNSPDSRREGSWRGAGWRGAGWRGASVACGQ
jgi:hypothetical protein